MSAYFTFAHSCYTLLFIGSKKCAHVHNSKWYGSMTSIIL